MPFKETASTSSLTDFLNKYLGLISVTLLAGVLRFVNLGYSDFQGDEFKAFFIPEAGQTITEFLLTQRKGPIQFIVTYLLQYLDPSYTNGLLMRLPFAIAGTLAVFFFYKLLDIFFNRQIAFFGAFFMATNGFFVAFSRIVQYQSLVILFMILALYMFALAATNDKWSISGIYLGFIFWALSVLSHYDGVFIAPFVLYILLVWVKRYVISIKTLVNGKLKNNLKHLVLAGLIFVLMLSVFYIPFILNIDTGTLSYWKGRIGGTGGKISSSTYLFSVYQPIYVIHIYYLLFLFGVFNFLRFTFVNIFRDLSKLASRLGILELILKVKDISQKLKFKSFKPAAAMFFAVSRYFQQAVGLFFWFLIPFLFLEVFIEIPGTHIYTYLVPAFVFLAFGVEAIFIMIEKSLEIGSRILKYTKISETATILHGFGVFVVFAFIWLQSYAVFVDNGQEYPFESEKFLVFHFPDPTPTYHLSIFGFPYYRGWEQVGEFTQADTPMLPCPKGDGEIQETCTQPTSKYTYYSTNERDSIARNHIPFKKDTDNSGYYVFVHNSQSFTGMDILVNKKFKYWASNYDPVFENYRESKSCDYIWFGCEIKKTPLVSVYYMKQGSLEEIKDLGY